jgi:uncharacterized membrane protein
VPAGASGGWVAGTDGGSRFAGGVVTGENYTDHRAAVWRDGTVTFTAAEPKTRAHDVNRAGIVVGTRGDAPAMGEQAVLWRGDGPAVTLARPSGASRTVATGISDDGVIAGIAGYPDGRVRGLLWNAAAPGSVRGMGEDVDLTGISPDGSLTGVTGPFEDHSAVGGRPGSVRLLPTAGDSDQAYGSAGTFAVGVTSVGPSGDRAVLWEAGKPWLLRGTLARATAVNTAGLVAGTENTRPAVWRDGALTVLPGAVTMTDEATAVTEDGIVAGRLGDDPVLWTCT